jgi:hypothetical protein
MGDNSIWTDKMSFVVGLTKTENLHNYLFVVTICSAPTVRVKKAMSERTIFCFSTEFRSERLKSVWIGWDLR